MVARSTCLSPFCGTRLLQRLDRCPNCGRRMFDDVEIGRRGRHLLPLGLVLIAAMAASAWMLDLVDLLGGASGSRLRGMVHQAWLLLAGFGSIALMGAACVVSAIQMITGRSSRIATLVMLAAFLIGLILIGIVVVQVAPAGLAEMRNEIS